jgi:6-pyruvoyltetrahydropterin/6-carboxytetrahydropterin synthase
MKNLSANIIVQFSSGKRLKGFKGNCQFVHGYTHKVQASFTSSKLENNMVVDFYELKKTIEDWINKNWDHNLLLNKRDKKLGDFINAYTGQKTFYFEGDPTSENMGMYLKDKVFPKLLPNLICTKVVVYDNDTSFIEVI